MRKTFVKHPGRLFVFGAALLALLLAFSTCGGGAGGGDDPGDSTNLGITIAAAEKAMANVRQASSASEVPSNIKWVTSAQWNTFAGVLGSAKTVRADSNAAQGRIDSADAALKTALGVFNSAKQSGTGAALDLSLLTSKINAANDAKRNIVVSEDASNVAFGSKYVTQTDMTALEEAIRVAEGEKVSSTITQPGVTSAAGTLQTAIDDFNGALQNGTKTIGFTSDELTGLIGRAQAAREGVFVVTDGRDGDDFGPEDRWIDGITDGKLNTAITNAEAEGADIDTVFNVLNSILENDYKPTYGNPTGTVKAGLFEYLEEAESAKDGIVEAASRDKAEMDSNWATPGQFGELNEVLDTARDVYDDSNASVNEVEKASSDLGDAIGIFETAVRENGPGTRDQYGKVTVTGMGAFNGREVEVFLSSIDTPPSAIKPDDLTEIEINSDDVVVIDGRFTVQLLTRWGDSPWYKWTASGSHFICFMISSEDDSQDFAYYISRSKHDFNEDSAPELEFSGFRKLEAFAMKIGDFTDEYPDDGLKADILFLMMSSMMTEGEVVFEDYADFKSKTGESIYKDKALTTEFSGNDTIYKDTVMWTSRRFSDMPMGAATDLAAIKGTFTLTELPANVSNVTVSMGLYPGGAGSRFSFSTSERYTTVKNGQQFEWEIPVTANDLADGIEWADLYDTEFSTSFEVKVMLDSGRSYEIVPYHNEMKTITIPAGTRTVENIAFGSHKAGYITMSGTLNVKYKNSAVREINFSVFDSSFYNSELGYKYFSSGTNQSWEILLPNPGTALDVGIFLASYTEDNEHLFSVYIPIGEIAANEDKLGIDLNIGNLMPDTLTVMNAPAGTYSVAAFGTYSPENPVGEDENASGGSVSTASWDITNGQYGFVIKSGNIVKTSRPVFITDGIAVVDWNTMEKTDAF